MQRTGKRGERHSVKPPPDCSMPHGVHASYISPCRPFPTPIIARAKLIGLVFVLLAVQRCPGASCGTLGS
jgi:hypothetical protein